MRWMRRRGDRVTITTGKYAGHSGTVESSVFQRTVDCPDKLASGYRVAGYGGAGYGAVGPGGGAEVREAGWRAATRCWYVVGLDWRFIAQNQGCGQVTKGTPLLSFSVSTLARPTTHIYSGLLDVRAEYLFVRIGF